jgi:DNA-binding response OmpR family regulator
MKKRIEAWGLAAHTAEDFREIDRAFEALKPHLVLLDISLPFFDGYHWCREIRKISKVPVVFVSSALDNMNVIMAMNMGGDDYIVKPFDLDVLMAKIQAILRRTYDFGDSALLLTHRGAALDTADASLSYAGERIELTKNEYRILLALLESKGKIVSRERLMERLWDTDSFIDENTLTVNVARLRKKLDAAGLRDFIATKKGMGYILE